MTIENDPRYCPEQDFEHWQKPVRVWLQRYLEAHGLDRLILELARLDRAGRCWNAR
jgi:hypothetical protein